MSGLSEQLAHILATLRMPLSASVQNKMLRYLALLQEWNRVYNLTAIRDPQQMLVRHIADALAVAQHLTGDKLIDVGTGAGVPGVPLALAFPDWQWTLLDSNGKKTRFLVQVKAELQLANVTVVHSRVEDYKPPHCYPGVITRAWATLRTMIDQTRHLYCAGGVLWALKGKYPTEELQELIEPVSIFPVYVPGLNEERHLVRVAL